MVDTWVSSWLGGHKHGNSGNGATQRTHVTFQRFPSQFTNGMWFEADLRRSAAVGQGWLALYRVVTFAFFCYRCTMMYIYFASCPQSFFSPALRYSNDHQDLCYGLDIQCKNQWIIPLLRGFSWSRTSIWNLMGLYSW